MPHSAAHGRGFIPWDRQLHLYKICLVPFPGQRQIRSLAARLSGLGQVRNVFCSRCHWIELFCVTPVPKASLFLSWEPVPSCRLCCPSTTMLLFPHPYGPPVGKRPPPGALSPAPFPGPPPRCAEEGEDKRHKPATCWTTSPATEPAGAWLASPPSHEASLLWQEKTSSTSGGGEAFLAQEPVSGWVESPCALSRRYPLQSLGRSTGMLRAGAAGTAGAVTKSDTIPGAVLTRSVITREILKQNTQRNH